MDLKGKIMNVDPELLKKVVDWASRWKLRLAQEKSKKAS